MQNEAASDETYFDVIVLKLKMNSYEKVEEQKKIPRAITDSKYLFNVSEQLIVNTDHQNTAPNTKACLQSKKCDPLN